MSGSRTPTSPSAGVGASTPISTPAQVPLPTPRPDLAVPQLPDSVPLPRPRPDLPSAAAPGAGAGDPVASAPGAGAAGAGDGAAAATGDGAGAQAPTSPAAGADAEAPADSPVNSCPLGCPRCKAKITKEQMKEIFTSAADDKLQGITDAFNEAFEKFEINTCLRKSHFFAQIREEVGPSITTLAENMNYSVEGLKSTFKYFRDNPNEAALYGRSPGKPADQQAIANRAYANRIGNGNIASGDGWQFRGKGYIQLTGRSNYQNVQTEIDSKYPGSGIDIMQNEGDILTVRGGMISAMAYWTMNNLNIKADMGARDEDVNRITAVVNFHTKSYADRRTHFKQTRKTFKLSQCPNFEGHGESLLERLKD
ncbi:glycoside hydrolase family 19 protein [Chondromyces crocatus]|uniref:Glycoside hydrolase family 19 catalytic domain-containing protein n=1 Tax=Chondromyces crocatus TaxID=52 RepID=A0A0K1ECW6_CHOCO|nr:hypothetical protein [Chondromyces crocatus]AKT38418.1 uncharacterized protein CMC5_025640 [Chondromyces crocatus]